MDAVTVVDGYLGHGIVGVVWCGVPVDYGGFYSILFLYRAG